MYGVVIALRWIKFNMLFSCPFVKYLSIDYYKENEMKLLLIHPSRPPFFSRREVFFWIFFSPIMFWLKLPLFFFPGSDRNIKYNVDRDNAKQQVKRFIICTSQPSSICKLRPKSKYSTPIPATMRIIFPSPNCCCPFAFSSSSSSLACCGV